jgi:phosphoserine phosphatase
MSARTAAQLLEEVAAALDAGLPADVEPWAIFDADGTLWSGDIGLSAFLAQPAAGLLHDDMQAPLAAWCVALGLVSTVAELSSMDARALHAFVEEAITSDRLLDVGRAAGREDDDVLGDLYALHAWLYAGQRIADVEAHGVRVFHDSIRGGLFASTPTLLAGLDRLGVRTVIISASPELIVRGAAVELGVPAGRALGMATVNNDEMVGRDVPRIVHGPGKVEVLRELLHGDRRPLLAAGDSAAGGDRELLDTALMPVSVAPRGRHLERARAQGFRLLDPHA